MGDGRHLIDFGRNFMGVGAEGWAALQAVHGAVHSARIGLKYTWFGPGYISNMYFKLIANKPIYRLSNKGGGDLSFFSAGCEPIVDAAVGSPEGAPVAMTGWRASCMMAWDTTEGGPCVLRPIAPTSWDAPAPDKLGQGCNSIDIFGLSTNLSLIMLEVLRHFSTCSALALNFLFCILICTLNSNCLLNRPRPCA